jgi:predicted PurR-regulated permease PerM
MKNNVPSQDITRIILAVLAIGMLVFAAFWIVKPFLLSMIWASIIVAATWPLLLRMENLLWGKRGLAAASMAAILALVFVIPLIAALGFIVKDIDRIVAWLENMKTFALPLPPQWVDALPVVGPKLSGLWHDVATGGTAGLSARMAPHVEEIAAWFFTQAQDSGKTALGFLLTLIIAGIFYYTGDTCGRGVLRFAQRLAGDRGEEAVILAAKSVRGVALGVVGTALIQAIAGGLGLMVSGVPAAALLTALMFILCLAQLGPSPVLVPAVVWIFWSGYTGWGIFLSVWTLIVSTIDNFLRPMLIRKSVDLPLFLVFPGVIGGLLTLGIIGVFVGPVILAVTYSLLVAWIKEGESQ